MIGTPSQTACFTGHRPETFGASFCEKTISQQLQYAILLAISKGYHHFYCGMAKGVDLIAGESILMLRNTIQPLSLTAVIPFSQQTYYWENSWIERYHNVLTQADQRLLMSQQYTADCFSKRNRYMVDHSKLLIALCLKNKRQGGTAQTIRYARQENIEIHRIFL